MRRTLIVLMLFSCTALAGSVYLNGVKIDGVSNQKFERVTVRIDEKGNVLIEAPGYAVKQVEGPPPDATGPAQGTISKHYFLVTEQNVTGMTEYDVDLHAVEVDAAGERSAREQQQADQGMAHLETSRCCALRT